MIFSDSERVVVILMIDITINVPPDSIELYQKRHQKFIATVIGVIVFGKISVKNVVCVLVMLIYMFYLYTK